MKSKLKKNSEDFSWDICAGKTVGFLTKVAKCN